MHIDPRDLDVCAPLRNADRGMESCLIFQRALDAVLIHDAVEHKILESNPAAEGLYAAQSGQLTGMCLLDLFAEEDKRAAHEALNSGTYSRLRDLAQVNLRGESIFVETSSTPVDFRGVKALMTTVRDRHARHESRERLQRERDDALRAASNTTTHVAAISHELRTPMNGILGMSGLLLDTPMREDQREYVETIQNAAESMLTLINEILDLGKLESGRMTVDSQSFAPSSLLGDCKKLLGPRATEKGITFDVVEDTSLPANVQGDADRIRQILINLVGNAIKFTERGGVSLKACTTTQDDEHATLRFEVHDTGVGIDTSEIESIFEPFGQGRLRPLRAEKGTGLGLAICRKLLALMDSEFEVQSDPGQGSCFAFELTLPRSEIKAVTNLANRGGGAALFVGALGDLGHTIAARLTEIGAPVEAAETSDDALGRIRERAAGEQPFRMVFVAQRLPDLDGETVGRSVRNRLRLPDVPLVLVQTSDRPIDDRRAKRSGYDFLIRETEDVNAVTSLFPTVGPETASGSVAAAALDSGAGQPHVLVVEDNPVNQKVVCHMLRRLGFEVTLAEDGSQGLDQIRGDYFDAILMDCQMPVMDGYEATRSIRGLGNGRAKTPIIALTANAMDGDREKCLAAGMDDYLTKPAKSDQLREMLLKWIPECAQRLDSEPASVG